MNILDLEFAHMKRIVEAIDKRVNVFEYIGETALFSENFPQLLGISEQQWALLKNDKNALLDYLMENSTEIRQPEGSSFKHFIGIIDKDERYVTFKFFTEDGDIYGFAVDKTVEVYGKFRISDELNEVRRQSEIDALTGLVNRKGFETIVKKSLLSNPSCGTLLIMDMDNFKLVNDMLGHPTGDKVLKQFADILKGFFGKETSIAGRIGGDEFVVFISEPLTAGALSEKLSGFINTVKEQFAKDYPEQKLSASVGACFAGIGTNDYDTLYKSADNALYSVKRNGKGNYHIG